MGSRKGAESVMIDITAKYDGPAKERFIVRLLNMCKHGYNNLYLKEVLWSYPTTVSDLKYMIY